MAKYKVEITLPDGETFVPEEEFDSYDEAEEFGCQWCSDYSTGAEILNMSNPGDYPLDDEGPDFEVYEVD